MLSSLVPSSILVVGAGRGLEARYLAAKYPASRLVIVDSHPRTVDYLRDKVRSDPSLVHVEVHLVDATKAELLQPFSDAAVLISFFVLHLLQSPAETTAMWNRVFPRALLVTADWKARGLVPKIDSSWSSEIRSEFRCQSTNPKHPETEAVVLRMSGRSEATE
ncbi:class I SAM-dependent methyltransferase [Arthrobacter sp. CG_A4]|uniref:class I SAM-dependent methyltransferase n=1 Tax=Arthrobacter sp. CG_A4 TaxID=3071706 RepID=UPI003FA3D770